MKRWLYRSAMVSGAPVALEDTLRRHLPQLLRSATATPEPEGPPRVDGSFPLHLSAHVGRRFSKTVTVTVGVASRTRAGDLHIPIRWRAEPVAALFPQFDGAIELEALSARRALLSLYGNYSPPFGPVGMVIDSLALHAVAQDTAGRLVSALALALSEAVTQPPPAEATASSGAPPLRVADLLTPDPVVLRPDMSLREAAQLLVRLDVGGAPVVDDDGRLVGVLSDSDLIEKEAAPRYGLGRAAAESERRRSARTVGDACTRPARTTVPEATVQDAARAMLDHDVARLVVVDEAQIKGIITRRDVLRALLRSDADLAAAADQALADLGEGDVEVTVEGGEVVLAGTASLRSRIPDIVERVRQIDGVLAVHDELGWAEDDVTPYLPPVLFP